MQTKYPLRLNSTFFLIILIFNSLTNAQDKAFCAVIVADCLNEEHGYCHEWESGKECYDHLPTCVNEITGGPSLCKRVFQLLLHQEVRVIEEKEFEVLVVTLDKWGWTLKKNIKFQRKCSPDFLTKMPSVTNGIVLTVPFYDQLNGLKYSAGTCFAVERKLKHGVEVAVYNAEIQDFETTCIAHGNYKWLSEVSTLSPERKKTLFITLIKKWATAFPFFALVSGGQSILQSHSANNFSNVKSPDEKENWNYWQRPQCNCNLPHMGVDSNGVIALAARICSLEYGAKDANATLELLAPALPVEFPENGDLLWVLGQLFVISDVIRNKIITTMSYESGYGRLVELSLKQVFKEFSTYSELLDIIRDKKTLTLYKQDGSPERTVHEVKILKLI